MIHLSNLTRPLQALLYPIGLAWIFLASGCIPEDYSDLNDPAKELQMEPAVETTSEFIDSFEELFGSILLYAYVTKEGEILIYRRDLDAICWVTLSQFQNLLTHAVSKSDYVVYNLEDPELTHPACEKAFHCILEAKTDTIGPTEPLPFVREEIRKRDLQSEQKKQNTEPGVAHNSDRLRLSPS